MIWISVRSSYLFQLIFIDHRRFIRRCFSPNTSIGTWSTDFAAKYVSIISLPLHFFPFHALVGYPCTTSFPQNKSFLQTFWCCTRSPQHQCHCVWLHIILSSDDNQHKSSFTNEDGLCHGAHLLATEHVREYLRNHISHKDTYVQCTWQSCSLHLGLASNLDIIISNININQRRFSNG